MNGNLKARLKGIARGLVVFLLLLSAYVFAHVVVAALKPREKPQDDSLMRRAERLIEYSKQ